MRLRTRIALHVVVVLGLALLPTCATMGIFVGGTRMAAPLVCPSGTAKTEVVSRWGGSSRGGSSLKWDLYCLTAEGHGSIPSTPKLALGVGVVWMGLAIVLLLLLRARRWLKLRGKTGGPHAG